MGNAVCYQGNVRGGNRRRIMRRTITVYVPAGLCCLSAKKHFFLQKMIFRFNILKLNKIREEIMNKLLQFLKKEPMLPGWLLSKWSFF